MFLGECNVESSNALAVFGSRIAKMLKKATDLRLFFDTSRTLTDAGTKKLALKLARDHTMLKHLSLGFNSCFNLSLESLSDFVHQLKSLEHLKGLALTFKVSLGDDNTKALEYLTRDISAYFTGLEYLSLNLDMCKMVDGEQLTISAQEIGRHLKNLQHFRLRLAHCNIDDVGMHLLAFEVCQYLRNLERLELDFSGNYEIYDDGFGVWGTELKCRGE